MSCDESGEHEAAADVFVEREIEIAAPPEQVWEELPVLLSGDGDRIRVVDDETPTHRLAFWWAAPNGDEPPSYVDIRLEPCGVGTVVHVRETRLDGAHLVRSAFHALARV